MSNTHLRKTVISINRGKEKIIQEKPFLTFSDNDYLGLSHHHEVKQAFVNAVNNYGCASAPLYLTGYTEKHQEFEQAISGFLKTEKTILFSSGYAANLAAITSLADRNTVIIHDKLNHRSLFDGSILSGAKFVRYEHNNMDSLEKTLQKYSGYQSKNRNKNKIIIICDGVFSMDGDIAVLPKIVALKRIYKSILIVDDAHGFGHIGEGRGILEHYQVDPTDVDLITATLSKGMGISGGFISGKAQWIDLIEHQASGYIFSCALMPAFPSAGLKGLEIMQTEKWRFGKIQKLAAYLKSKMAQNHLTLIPSDTAIQPLLLGRAKRTYDFSVYLYRNGIYIAPICFPVVPEGQGRLRITLTANHSTEDIDKLTDLLLLAKKEIDHE